jgi:hypothetical protein
VPPPRRRHHGIWRTSVSRIAFRAVGRLSPTSKRTAPARSLESATSSLLVNAVMAALSAAPFRRLP